VPSRRCPLCHSEQITHRATFSTARLTTAWRERFQIDIEGEFHGAEGFALGVCGRCDLQFFPGELAGSGAMYEQLQRHDWYYIHDKWEHREALGAVRPGDRLLEIGSGEGDFVALARAQGAEALGIELNPGAVRRAAELGRPVEPRALAEVARERPGEFDVVASFQLLEHVADPRAFFDDAVRLLRPGGLLLTAVPNADSWIRHQDNLLDLPPHHVTRWTPRCLRGLGDFLPLEFQHLSFEPLPRYHVAPFVDAYADALGGVSDRLRPGRVGRALARLALARGPLRWRLQGQGVYAIHRRTR
jgi:SAM-dependent methyltransferase